MIDIQIWHNQSLWGEWEYNPEVNQMETIESIMEAFDSIEGPGDGFTLIANKIG